MRSPANITDVMADSRQADVIEFVIPGDPIKDLGPNQRPANIYAHHRLTQEWKTRAWLCWAAAERPRLSGKVRMTLTLRRGRAVDPDNALAACKALIDGLTDQPGRPALLPSDGPHDVEYGAVGFEVEKRWQHHPEAVVRVERCEGVLAGTGAAVPVGREVIHAK